MRKYGLFTTEELKRFKADTEGKLKAYNTAIFKNKDYTSEIDRLRMLSVYNALKVDLKDVMWELEGRELGIIA